MTTNIILHEMMNTKTIAEFVEYIKTRAQTSTQAWLEIAHAFAEAKEMYGSESDAFRKLLKETEFSRATANKLSSIATSKRLEKYKEKLSAVHSWSTLYTIHSLADERFEKVKEAFALDNKEVGVAFITIRKLEALFKQKIEETSFKLYATIKLDEEAMRGRLFDGGDYENLENLLEQIQTTIPYLKVIRTDVDGKIESQFQSKIVKYIDTIGRQQLLESLNTAISKYPHKKGEKSSAKFQRLFKMSKDELLMMFNDSPKEAFEYIGGTYDQADVYNQAVAKASKWSESIADKVRSSREAYYAANNIIQSVSKDVTLKNEQQYFTDMKENNAKKSEKYKLLNHSLIVEEHDKAA